MTLSQAEREALRMMFGGRCAYCGCELGTKWHADHVSPIERECTYVPGKWDGKLFSGNYTPGHFEQTGECRHPENDTFENMFPACVRCNILKSNADVEGFRAMLGYFARSIPEIPGYSHVHHLMRFAKLTIDPTPVVFWFEKWRAEHSPIRTQDAL